jgi:hypothetical protein
MLNRYGGATQCANYQTFVDLTTLPRLRNEKSQKKVGKTADTH